MLATTSRGEMSALAHIADLLDTSIHDAARLDHRFIHRLNTIAGSMRKTLRIEASAEITHITTVSRNSRPVKFGVITIGSADSLVICTTKSPIRIAMLKPATALSSA